MQKIAFLVLFVWLWAIKPVYGNDQDILIFYHIPKTGGMTISNLLDLQFKPELICKYHYYHNIEDKSIQELKKYKLIRGHFFFQSPLTDLENVKLICFLRDPVERVLSEQRYLEQYFSKYSAVLYKDHFLSEGRPIDTISNQQCRFLSGYDRRDLMITDAMHLTSAKHNLQKRFFFVGITERMNDSISMLYTFLGWKMPKTISKCNTTKHDMKYQNPTLIEQIKQKNWADIELYEFAKSLFESKYREFQNLISISPTPLDSTF